MAVGRPLASGEARKQWAARLPVSIIEAIQSIAAERGISQSDVVSLAVSALKSGT